MKKALIAIFALVMVVALAACGASDKNSAPSSTPTSSANAGAQSASTSSTTPGKVKSIQEFLETPAMKQQLEALSSTTEAGGMKIEITAEDNKLIYSYTYNQQIPNVDTMKSALESATEAQSFTFEAVASSIKQSVNVNDPVVVVRYRNADGSEIFSKEFTAR